MNIKNIIKEEIDDFKWADDITPFDDSGKYKIWLGRTSIDNQNKALQYIFDLGVTTGLGDDTVARSVDEMGHNGILLTTIFFERLGTGKFRFGGWMGAQLTDDEGDTWYEDENDNKYVTDEKLKSDLDYYKNKHGIEVDPNMIEGYEG